MKRLSYDDAVKLVRRTVLGSSPISPIRHITQCSYPSGIDCDYHSRNTATLSHAILTLSGRIVFQELNRKELLCVPGTVLIIPKYCNIRWQTEKDTVLFQCFHEDFNLEEHGALATLFGPLQRHLATVETGLELAENLEHRLALAKTSYAKELMYSLAALDFLGAAVEAMQRLSQDASQESGHSSLSRCLNHIERNLHREMTLQELSGHSCLGVSRLSEVFRESLGVSPMQYIARRKTEIAERLLSAEGGLSVGEVATRLGFNSLSYFSRFFKRQTGRNPSSIIVR
jgi:AraC-like DNA-binding protein